MPGLDRIQEMFRMSRHSAWVGWVGVAMLAAGVLALAPVASAPAETPIFDFEGDIQGWASALPAAKVAVTHLPAEVKVGKGALVWAYDPKAPNAMLGRADPQLKAGAAALD